MHPTACERCSFAHAKNGDGRTHVKTKQTRAIHGDVARRRNAGILTAQVKGLQSPPVSTHRLQMTSTPRLSPCARGEFLNPSSDRPRPALICSGLALSSERPLKQTQSPSVRKHSALLSTLSWKQKLNQ